MSIELIRWCEGIRLLFGLLGLVVIPNLLASEPIPVESMVDMRSFPWETPVNLSPDGAWVAYTVVQPVRSRISTGKKLSQFTLTGATLQSDKAEVWAANTRTHEQIQISAQGSSSWDPAWSPDGHTIALYSDADGIARLWLWDLKTRTRRRASDVPVHPFTLPEAPVWGPDSRYIFVKIMPSTEGNRTTTLQDPAAFTPLVFDNGVNTDNQNNHDASFAVDIGLYTNLRADLARIDISNGQVDVLDRDKYIVKWLLSPDGHRLVFAAVDGAEKHTRDFITFTLWLVDPATGGMHALATHLPMELAADAMSWSPDGSQLAYAVRQTSDYHSAYDCYILRVDRDEAPVLLSVRSRPAQLDYFTVPVWTADGSTVLLHDTAFVYAYHLPDRTEKVIRLPQGRIAASFIVSHARPRLLRTTATAIQLWETNTETMNTELHLIDYSTGRDILVRSDAIALGDEPPLSSDVSRDGSVVIYQCQATDSPADLWVADRSFAHTERLTITNPHLAGKPFGPSRLISWRTSDGKDLHGALLLPPDYKSGTRVPLLVEVYGGDDVARFKNHFGMVDFFIGMSHQLFASRGYAVLAAQTSVNVGTPMLDLLKSILPAVDKAVEIGVAHPDTIGLMGASYGGYSTLAIISQTDRFKAAAAIAPTSDLMDITTWIEDDGSAPWFSWAEDSQGRMGASLWQSRERYIENSPLFYADRIHTPVLLAAGGTDSNAVRGAREMFASLRYLHRKAEYAEYPGGTHLPDYWTRDQQVDFANRMLGWFDRFLKGPSGAQSQ